MGDVGSPAPQALPRKVHEEEIKRAARKGRFFNWGGSGSEMRRVVEIETGDGRNCAAKCSIVVVEAWGSKLWGY